MPEITISIIDIDEYNEEKKHYRIEEKITIALDEIESYLSVGMPVSVGKEDVDYRPHGCLKLKGKKNGWWVLKEDVEALKKLIPEKNAQNI